MRSNALKLMLSIAVCCGFYGMSNAMATESNPITDVTMAESSAGRVVTIHTEKEPTFTVFRLYDPMRVIIDISNGDPSKYKGPIEFQDGVIGAVAFHHFKSGKRSIGRVIVGFEKNMRYEVRSLEKGIRLLAFSQGSETDAPLFRAPPPPAPPMDYKAIKRAEKAQALANKAIQIADAERNRALQMQSELAEKQKSIEAREAEIAQKQQEAQQAAQTIAKLKERMQNSLQSEKKALEQKAAEIERQRTIAEKQRQTLQVQQNEAQAAMRSLQSKQQAVQKAAQQAEKRAEKKLHEAEVALNEANQMRKQALEKLARAEAEREKAAQVRDLAQVAKEELQQRKQALEKQRAQLETERNRQFKLSKQITEQKQVLSKNIENYRLLYKRLQTEREELEVEKAKLAAERRRLYSQKQAMNKNSNKSQQAALQAATQEKEAAKSQVKQLASQVQRLKQELHARSERIDQAKREFEQRHGTQRVKSKRNKAKLQRAYTEVAKLKKQLKAKEKALAAVRKQTKPTHVASAQSPARLRNIRINTQQGEYDIVDLDFVRTMPEHEVMTLEKPSRLVVDLPYTHKGRKIRRLTKVAGKSVARVRVGEHGEFLRVVLDMDSKVIPPYKIIRDGKQLRLQISKTVHTQNSQGGSVDAQHGIAQVKDIRFEQKPGHVIIDIPCSKRTGFHIDETSPKALVLSLEQATIPSHLERALDTEAFNGNVEMISSYQDRLSPPVVKFVVNRKLKTPQTARWVNNRLRWEIVDNKAGATQVARKKPKVTTKTSAAASFTSKGASIVSHGVQAQFKKSRAKRITIDLKDAEVVNVLRLIAEVSGENIITSDDVGGKITLKLRNVPWEQALDIILATKGLGKVKQNNIIRIAPLEELQREKEMELQKKKAEQMVAEPVKRVLYINYASAKELKAQLVPSLSGRGSIQEVERNNSLIINELPGKIDDLIQLAQALDTQTPQVLIEARIVEASSNYLQQLGIQWGGMSAHSPLYGNPTGLSFPNTMIMAGAADDNQQNQANGVLTPTNYAINLPAPIASGSGGGIGFTFGNSTNSTLLNLRLSALEETGAARIISAPRVATIDNKKAKIEQGIDIPISVVSAAGVNTKFISASLELEVQPHVTNDGSVLMQIMVSKNEPDFSRTGASGDPTIQKKMAETEVLVKDGDTTVIGGIYTRSTTQVKSAVPFLSKIPILGWLFKNTRNEDNRAELLVFITPRILNREAALSKAVQQQKEQIIDQANNVGDL